MSLSSIHIQKANSNCFKHNAREEEHPAYTIHSYHTDKNTCDISSNEAQNTFDSLYQERMNNNPHRKADKSNCLVEAVVNIEPDTTKEQLENLGKYIEKEFNFKLIQTATHKDEGHYNKDDIFKVNNHAHLVFLSIDENGKQMNRREHIDREKLSKLQDETANILKMERGETNSKTRRLSHKDFKEHKKRVEPLNHEIETLKNDKDVMLNLAINNDQENNNEMEILREKIEILNQELAILKEESKEHKKTLKNDLKTQKDINRELREELKENNATRSDYAQLEQENRDIIEKLKEDNKKQSDKQENLEKMNEILKSNLKGYQKEESKTKDKGMNI
jgi:chromosome segregation ATPase